VSCRIKAQRDEIDERNREETGSDRQIDRQTECNKKLQQGQGGVYGQKRQEQQIA